MRILLTIIFTLFVVIPGIGQNGLIELRNTDDISQYKLLYMSDIDSDVEISVLNPEGVTISKQTVEDKKGFSYTIDLEERASGIYYVEVFTPFYTLYDTISHKTKIDRLKGAFTGEVLGQKVIVTAEELSADEEFRLIINEDGKEIISDQTIRGSEFGTRVFDFNDSEAEVTNVSVYYKGDRINMWSVARDADP